MQVWIFQLVNIYMYTNIGARAVACADIYMSHCLFSLCQFLLLLPFLLLLHPLIIS